MTQDTPELEATIVVRRPLTVWRDVLRSYVIKVNGESAGVVKPGGEVVLPVPPGRHTLLARIDWTGSPEIDVELQAGEEAVWLVEPTGSALRVDQIFGSDRYLRLNRID